MKRNHSKQPAVAEDSALQRLKAHMVRINMALLTGVLVGVLAVLLILLGAQSRRITQETLNRMLSSRLQGGPGERPLFGGVLIEFDEDGNILHRTNPPELSKETVEQMKTLALSQAKDSGEVVFDEYAFAFDTRQAGPMRKLAFVDLSAQRELMRNAIFICLGAGSLSLLALWGLSMYLAGRAVQPVQQAFIRQRAFVADASHELKTPLAILNANLSLLKESLPSPAPEQKYVRAIGEQESRMANLIADMLELARLDDARAHTVFTKTDLSALVESQLLSFEALLFEQGLTLEASVAPDITVNGDALALEKLLGILLDNACCHTSAGGTVTVTLETVRDEAVLTVQNSGAGIEPSHLSHLFDRFYRVDSARARESGGYGLGLAIAQAIAAAHNAEICAESELGQYTRFVVRFR